HSGLSHFRRGFPGYNRPRPSSPGRGPAPREPSSHERRRTAPTVFVTGRNRSQRDPWAWDRAQYRGPHRDAGRVRRVGGRPPRRGLHGLWRDADPAIPILDALPRHPLAEGQARAEGARSLGHLPADRGHLYAVHPHQPARRLGLDPVRTRLGHGAPRHHPQGRRHRPFPVVVDRPLPGHGLAGGGGAQTADRGGLARRCPVAVPGRPLLYPGSRLLQMAPVALPPRGMASVRPRRQRVPLLRGPALRIADQGVTGGPVTPGHLLRIEGAMKGEPSMRLKFLLAAFLLAAVTVPSWAAPASSPDLQARRDTLKQLLAEQWEYNLSHSPEFASILGDKRWNDKM